MRRFEESFRCSHRSGNQTKTRFALESTDDSALNELIESSVPCGSDFQDKPTNICEILSFVGREEIDLVNCEIPGLIPRDPA